MKYHLIIEYKPNKEIIGGNITRIDKQFSESHRHGSEKRIYKI